MYKRLGIALLIALALGIVVVAALQLLGNINIAVLNPKGVIALKERNLMLLATLLSLVVVIPVFVLTFTIAWRYRAGNTKARYMPDWDRNKALEATWWAVPFVLIFVLSIITWRSSHELDPTKPLQSSQKPITVQVVALDWKWLFIYPEQGIATVNYVQFPKDTPVAFELTSDAPMNSFWIPQLGGQIYTMAGMTTQLHLMASEVGAYNGSSANISGRGFAGMRFVAQSTTQTDFDAWVRSVKLLPGRLSSEAYDQLARPSENNPASSYSSVEAGLYDKVIMKYMMPMVTQ